MIRRLSPDRSVAVSTAVTRFALVAGLLVVGAARAGAQAPAAAQLAERADGAERVVVGRVSGVNGAWRTNDFGDRLIVSTVRVAVEEALKGEAETTLDVEVEGGTVGNLTLRVSDITPLAPGDRAVFYVRRNARGAFIPHRRGAGLLRLDRSQRVAGSSLTLDDVRRAVRGRQRQ
jgi:hypothetical protein